MSQGEQHLREPVHVAVRQRCTDVSRQRRLQTRKCKAQAPPMRSVSDRRREGASVVVTGVPPKREAYESRQASPLRDTRKGVGLSSYSLLSTQPKRVVLTLRISD
ncbi:MAG: hypothetical protein KME30_26660 [Iphinoe sp. HA4291-MV1]|jgi:hypothetical protein|nr:hypothetical protein [Iphinoe sp. HA4291-MV1]